MKAGGFAPGLGIRDYGSRLALMAQAPQVWGSMIGV